MSSLVLDTNAYAAFMAGDANMLGALQAVDRIVMSVVVMGELLAGFAAGSRRSENRRELSAFLASPRVEVSPMTTITAEFYAAVYGQLRQKGRPLPTNDLWVAAVAFEHGAPLLSLDAHFREIDGLLVAAGPQDLVP